MTPTTALTAFALAGLVGWQPTGFRWNPGELPIPYCISNNAQRTNASRADVRAAIVNSINSWRAQSVGGGLSCSAYDARDVSAQQQCRVGINLRDGDPNIFFQSSWSQGSQTLGVTHYVGTGRACGSLNGQQLQCISDADIELNDANVTWSVNGRGGTDVESIMVHEYGHFIGLGHCNENGTCRAGQAVMYAAYLGGSIRVPFPDDVTGACTLYQGTPGGVGYPCQNGNQCSSGICVTAAGGAGGYCSTPCTPGGTTCPQNYKCDPNPANPAQNVCVRDDGLNRALCEECSGVPGSCANSGACVAGLPETNGGRCVTPCPNPNIMDGGCPSLYTCARYTSGFYCIPKSSDCTDLNNFTELDLGQSCSGDPPCRAGLTCIGICSQECTAGSCPNGYQCETFQFQSGPRSFCAPPVNEGQSCEGIQACTVGPCLQDQSGRATCYQDCTGNPGACNNAQTCVEYTVSGRTVGLCEPPGVPPRPDGGVVPDTGTVVPDGGGVIESDGGVGPSPDGGVGPAPDTGGGGGGGGPCACDKFFYCESDCACDAECPCACDLTFACDPDPNAGGQCSCDPECASTTGGGGSAGGSLRTTSGGCGGCATTGAESPGGALAGLLLLLGLLLRRRR
jgi:uncharacterized protein (TIGR03382 family)